MVLALYLRYLIVATLERICTMLCLQQSRHSFYKTKHMRELSKFLAQLLGYIFNDQYWYAAKSTQIRRCGSSSIGDAEPYGTGYIEMIGT